MSRLLRLYPATWRERYGAEFIDTLDERPVGPAGTVDVIRGAIDAHLHPELIAGVPRPWTHRLPGVLATAAGLIWSWYYVRIALAAPADWGYGVLFAMLLMLVAVLGDYMGSYARQIGITTSAVLAAALLAGIEPLSLVGGGVFGFVLAAAAALLLSGGMLTLVAIRAGMGVGARWLLIAAGLLIPAVVAIPVMGGFGPTDPGGLPAMVIAILPYGVAWTLVGIRMTLRGSATVHDEPSTNRSSQVMAA